MRRFSLKTSQLTYKEVIRLSDKLADVVAAKPSALHGIGKDQIRFTQLVASGI